MALLIIYTVKFSNNIGTRVIQTVFLSFSSHLLKLVLTRQCRITISIISKFHQADDLLCMKSVGGAGGLRKIFFGPLGLSLV